MRVALVVPTRSDCAHRRVSRELGSALAARGHAVFRFPTARGLKPASARAALERLLRVQRVEICHAQYFSRGLDYLSRVRLPEGTRLILTHQGAALEFMDHPQAFSRLARRAFAVTSVSSTGLNELRERYPALRKKSAVVFNGVDLKKNHRPNAADSRRAFILCVSRLAAYKGVDLLALAFARLLSQGRDLDLVVCGPDQTGGRLRRFVERLGLGGRVRFLGDVAAPEVARLMARCLFFVLPSRRENLPMALLEAMAAGKAVAAARVGGVPEVITDGVDGLLFKPNDVAGLSEALAALAQDAALRRRLGCRARARAESFGWPAAAARYEELYRL